MKSLIIVFGALLLIIATPFVFESIDDTLTEDYTQNFAGVSTGAGVNTANVTLGRAIYNNDTSSVTAITSSTDNDSPTAASYNSASRALGVSGLEASTSRTLSVTFDIDRATLPDGISAFLTLLRWFYVFIIVGMAGGAIYAFFD